MRDTDSEIMWRMAEEAIWKMPTSMLASTAYAGHLQAHTYLRGKGQGHQGPSFCFQPREPQGAEPWGSEQESKLTHTSQDPVVRLSGLVLSHSTTSSVAK